MIMLYWPQLIMLFIYALLLVYGLVNHGEPYSGRQNFWGVTLYIGLQIWLLYMGGFFEGLF